MQYLVNWNSLPLIKELSFFIFWYLWAYAIRPTCYLLLLFLFTQYEIRFISCFWFLNFIVSTYHLLHITHYWISICNTIYLSFLFSLIFSIFSFAFLTRYFLCIAKRADTRSAPTRGEFPRNSNPSLFLGYIRDTRYCFHQIPIDRRDACPTGGIDILDTALSRIFSPNLILDSILDMIYSILYLSLTRKNKCVIYRLTVSL